MSEGKKKCFTCAGGEMHLSVEEQWECDGCGEIETAHIHDRLVAALKKAWQLTQIATDWNLDEVEIDGEMVRTYDLAKEFKAALKAAGEEV